MRFPPSHILGIICSINPASSSATLLAGQSASFLDDPQTVRVVLHPGGIQINDTTRRSWLRFHSRLPVLLVPGSDDPRETAMLRCSVGDVVCVATEAIRVGRRQRGSTVCVFTISDDEATSSPLVRLPGVDRPVALLAHFLDTAAGRFLRHLDAMELAGVELANIAGSFWLHLAAACEAGVSDAVLPWPDELEISHEEQP